MFSFTNILCHKSFVTKLTDTVTVLTCRAGHIALINWANAQKRWVIFDFLSERKWLQSDERTVKKRVRTSLKAIAQWSSQWGQCILFSVVFTSPFPRLFDSTSFQRKYCDIFKRYYATNIICTLNCTYDMSIIFLNYYGEGIQQDFSTPISHCSSKCCLDAVNSFMFLSWYCIKSKWKLADQSPYF